MEKNVWDKVVALNCNTVLAPVYWEFLEPEEGKFDFTLVDGLIEGARKRNLRLVPLWFGTWKNGISTYVPSWIKTDTERFPRAQCHPGKTCLAVSCMSEEACEADARAFTALMRHLRDFDSDECTVIMVQVENETGLLGAPRDRSPEAERVFLGEVPSDLMRELDLRKLTLHEELATCREDAGGRTSGLWSEVFGKAADEIFMAWHIARYVNRVAKAGRQEYPLPCFANAWISQYSGEQPGSYPSGGPVSRMRDIWQIAAPEIAVLSPDIYLDDFADVCADYTGGGNPLLIPEAKRNEEAAANVFYALGKHDALCFAPFGIESAEDPLLAKSYSLLSRMVPILSAHHGSGTMTAILQRGTEKEALSLGNYHLEVRYHSPRQPGTSPATAILIAETPDQFLILGHGGMDINFSSLSGELPNAAFLILEEGNFSQSQWIPGRRLNGDEHVVRLGAEPCVLRAGLYRYA